MRTALWTELRRSPMRWVLPLLLAMAVGMLFGRNTHWIGVWPEASAAAQNPAWFIAPVVAAGAAWSAGRVRRAGAEETLAASARPAWQQELVHVATTLAYGLLPLVVGAGVAAAASASEAGPGFLWPSYLVLGGSLVAIAAGLGHLAGRLIRSLMAAPAAAILVLLVAWTSDSFHVITGPPHLQITAPAIVSRAALAVAVLAAAVNATALGGRWWRTHPRNLAPPAAAVGALLVTVVAVSIAGPLRVERDPPDPPLCSTANPTVCVWPEHRTYLPELAAAAERLDALTGPVSVAVPHEFHERGLHDRVDADLEGFVLALAGEWPAVRGMVAAVTRATFPDSFCRAATSAAGDRRALAQSELREWLVSRAYGGPKPAGFFGGNPAAEAEANRVWQLPDAEQFAWANDKIATIEETPCAQ